MKLLKELDFIHNKKVNLTLNITAVLLIFPFLALFTWIAILMYGKGSEVFHFFDLFYLLVLMVIHELIHGFFFKVLGDENTKVKFGFKSGMAYATSPGSRYSRKRMLVIILAPFFLISLALTLIYALHISSLLASMQPAVQEIFSWLSLFFGRRVISLLRIRKSVSIFIKRRIQNEQLQINCFRTCKMDRLNCS